MNKVTQARSRLLAAVSGAMLLAALSAGVAHAQDAAAAPAAGQLDEVVVTAERKSTNAQTTAVSINAFSAEALTNRHIDNVVGLKQNIPNLVVEPALINPSGIVAFLRGAGQNGGFVNAESAVGIYIDDVYYARLTGINTDFPDLQSLEVLRGPQGTLYGRNTLTGAIKFNRRQPDGKTFGNIEASYGNYNEERIRGAYSAPITDNVAGLISASASKIDGWYHDAAQGGRRIGDSNQWAVRGSLAYTGGGPWSASANLSHINYSGDGALNTPYNPTTLKPVVGVRTYLSTINPSAKAENTIADLHIGYDFGPVQLKSITGYIKGTNSTQYDIYGGRQISPGAYAYAYNIQDKSSEEEFTQEFQVTGKAFDNRLEYIAGVYYFKETPGETVIYRTNFATPQNPYVYQPQVINLETDSYAVFGQATYHFTDALSATVGYRYTEDQKKESVMVQNGTSGTPPIVGVHNKVTYDSTTPKFTVDYRFTPDIYGYFTVSKGFQAGGFNASAAGNPTIVAQPYAPEEITAYEGGLKSEFLDHKLRFNVDYFVNKLTQLQLSAVNATNGLLYTQNAGSATVKGPEAEVRLTPVAGLEIFAQGAWTSGKYDSLNPTSTVATAHARHIPYISAFQGQLGFEDKIALNEMGMSGDHGFLTFGSTYSYRSSYYVVATNTNIGHLPAVGLWDAFVGWKSQDEKLSVTLSGKNLADELYYLSGSSSGGFGFRVEGPPRQVRLAVKYEY